MPGGDCTEPQGAGPRTGRGMGNCGTTTGLVLQIHPLELEVDLAFNAGEQVVSSCRLMDSPTAYVTDTNLIGA
jgi:hypothetical protein